MFEIDTEKASTAKVILDHRMLTDTVDAALPEVVRLRERQRLVELLFRRGALALDNPGTMAKAWH